MACSARANRFQLSAKEIGASLVGLHPVAMQQEVVNFIGEYQLFEVDPLFPQRSCKFHGLRETYVAVVVAMNQEHWRFPFADGGNRRRFEGDAGCLDALTRIHDRLET